jgi:cyclase
MFKKRVIAVLPVLNNIVVQSYGFKKYLPVGKVEIATEFLNSWGIDEIVLIDIGAGKQGTFISPDLVKKAASRCFTPLTAGGGISELWQADQLIHSGADKLCFNKAFFENPSFIRDVASQYGNQCVVVSIDVIAENNSWQVFDYSSGRNRTNSLEDVLKQAEANGAGEIFVNAVHKDGSFSGFDTELFEWVSKKVSVPVLACGGASGGYDFVALFKETQVSAGCAGNFFHFAEHAVNLTKQIILKSGQEIRMETQASYLENQIDSSGRLQKKSEADLEHLLYVKIEKEKI